MFLTLPLELLGDGFLDPGLPGNLDRTAGEGLGDLVERFGGEVQQDALALEAGAVAAGPLPAGDGDRGAAAASDDPLDVDRGSGLAGGGWWVGGGVGGEGAGGEGAGGEGAGGARGFAGNRHRETSGLRGKLGEGDDCRVAWPVNRFGGTVER